MKTCLKLTRLGFSILAFWIIGSLVVAVGAEVSPVPVMLNDVNDETLKTCIVKNFDGKCVTAGITVTKKNTLAENLLSKSSADDYVPGELIVKFRSTLPVSIGILGLSTITPGKKVPATASMLEKLNLKYGVRSTRPVFTNRPSAFKSLRRDRITPLSRPVEMGEIHVLEMSRDADPVSAAAEFSKLPEVEYAQPNYYVEPYILPDDPFYSSFGSWGQSFDDLWGLKKMQMEPAWDITQGAGSVVAVVDTGLDYSHPDIAGNVWTNDNEIAGNGIDDDGNGYVDDVMGWDFANNDNDPMDGYGHGTHVSGTIAAIGNNGLGIIGVAPQSKIMALKGLSDAGSGTIEALSLAIIYAAENGADVINNSWGCSASCPDNPIAEDAVRIAHSLGSVVVFAAGNSARDVSFYSPQNMAETITVAASTPTDTAPWFSNTGVVDVSAPGGGDFDSTSTIFQSYRNILSLKSSACGATCPDQLIVGGNFMRQAGTSMSAPHVSGLAALLVANGGLTSEQVRQSIRKGSDDVGDPGVDKFAGYGRVNALSALQVVSPSAALLTDPVRGTFTGTREIPIYGIAYGPQFANWALQYAGAATPGEWTDVTSSLIQSATTSELLYTWPITDIADGKYTLRLSVQNLNGEIYEDRRVININQVKLTSPASGERSFYRSGDVVEIIGTAASADMLSYTIKIKDGNGNWLPNPEIILANGGQVKVWNSVLATWNTAGLAADHYGVFLEVSKQNGSSTSEVAPVIVDPMYHPGWPIKLRELSDSSNFLFGAWNHLNTADINSDGRSDIIVNYASDVLIIDHTGKPLPGWPQTIDPDGKGSFHVFSPVAGDLTGDGNLEIVATNFTYFANTSQVFVWDSSGSLLPGWPREVEGSLTALTLGDVSGDGLNDIIITDSYSGIKVLDSNGNSLPGWPVVVDADLAYRPLSTASVADLNGDGNNEIVVVNLAAPTNLYVLSHDGLVLPGWPVSLSPTLTPGYGVRAYPVIGDLDGDDDTLEIAIGSGDGQMYVFKHDGSILPGWPQPTKGTYTNTPAIGDIDGDEKPELVIGTMWVREPGLATLNAYQYAWHSDGKLVPGWPVKNDRKISFGIYGYGAPALADIDGDEIADVIATTDMHLFNQDVSLPYTTPFVLKAHRSDGSMLPGFPRPTSNIGHSTNTVAVADMDGDGLLEMAWIDATMNLYMWDLTSEASTKNPWPMFQHDAQNTGSLAKKKVKNKVELKGIIEKVDTNFIVVNGIVVRITVGTVVKFEDNSGGSFTVGQKVELKGKWNKDGSVTAIKIQVYG